MQKAAKNLPQKFIFELRNSTLISPFHKTEFSCFTLPPTQHRSFLRKQKFARTDSAYSIPCTDYKRFIEQIKRQFSARVQAYQKEVFLCKKKKAQLCQNMLTKSTIKSGGIIPKLLPPNLQTAVP